MNPRRQPTLREHLDLVETCRARLSPLNANRIAERAKNESFAADVPSEAQDAWAELRRDAETLAASHDGGAR